MDRITVRLSIVFHLPCISQRCDTVQYKRSCDPPQPLMCSSFIPGVSDSVELGANTAVVISLNSHRL